MKQFILIILLSILGIRSYSQFRNGIVRRKINKKSFIINQSTSKKKVRSRWCVDLGLSVKWATCNLGATKPEEFGKYYAWGEIKNKKNYDIKNYKFCDIKNDYKVNKYCSRNDIGIRLDYKKTLSKADDAATSNLGNNWRMPSESEFNELLQKCQWTWITYKGTTGYKITSKLNGNSIFLPATGWYGRYINNRGSVGYYWSRSLSSGNDYPICLRFFSNTMETYTYGRYIGCTIRPVRP